MTFVWSVFQDLHNHRSIGMGLNPLTMTEMIMYLEIQGVTEGEEMTECLRYLSVLDNEFLQYHKEKNNA